MVNIKVFPSIQIVDFISDTYDLKMTSNNSTVNMNTDTEENSRGVAVKTFFKQRDAIEDAYNSNEQKLKQNPH